MVIFGASGDLAKRKLLPALYRLAYERRLPDSFVAIGNSRAPMSDDDFRDTMLTATKQFLEDSPFDEDVWIDFARKLYYVPGDANDPKTYEALKEKLASLGRRNVLFYLATQPAFYGPIVDNLGAAGIGKSDSDGWRRIVVEKPFGRDLQSARELNDRIHNVFAEQDIYRIDHYLGKETVQNIFAFRFGNGIFEPLWNRRYVNNVQITAAESIGIEGRGAYYDKSGAVRDMIQSHLLQLMATIGMESPPVFEAEAVRDERAKLLRSVRIMRRQEVACFAVPGQYEGYRQERDVDPNSQTPTYAAMTLYIDNWRWAGVPFYLRTGKKLAKRVTDIAIEFNAAPHALFTGLDGEPAVLPNLLIVRIQPEEGISLRFQSKMPGSGMRLRPVSMDFNYNSSFGQRSPSAYETLLVDAMIGDATLYTRQDMVELSWKIVTPVLDDWESRTFPFPNYKPGTWGPKEADDMLARSDHKWREG